MNVTSLLKNKKGKLGLLGVFLVLGILIFFVASIRGAPDAFLITEKTQYDLDTHTVDVEITELLGKNQIINVSNLYASTSATNKIQLKQTFMNQSYQSPNYGIVNVSLGKYSTTNSYVNESGSTITQYYTSTGTELICDYVLADKSCLVENISIINYTTKYDFLPIPDQGSKQVVNGISLTFKNGGIPIAKNEKVQLRFIYSHPIYVYPNRPTEVENKYDIRVDSADGVDYSILDPSWWNVSAEQCIPLTIKNPGGSVTNFKKWVEIPANASTYINTTGWGNIRFVNSSCNNDGTSMAYEMDYYNATSAGFWVNGTYANGNNNYSIYVMPKSTSTASNSGIWEVGFASRFVLHLQENSTAILNSYTPTNNWSILGTLQQNATNACAFGKCVGRYANSATTTSSLNHAETISTSVTATGKYSFWFMVPRGTTRDGGGSIQLTGRGTHGSTTKYLATINATDGIDALYVADGCYSAGTGSSTGTVPSNYTGNASDTNWHQFTMYWAGGTTYFYLDGGLIKSCTSRTPGGGGVGGDFLTRSYHTTANVFSTLTVDEARYDNVAINDSEIRYEYQNINSSNVVIGTAQNNPANMLQISNGRYENSFAITQFVKVNGTNFTLAGRQYTLMGADAYYLADYATNHTYDDVGNEINGSRVYVDEILDKARALDINVIRTWGSMVGGNQTSNYGSNWFINKSGGHYNLFLNNNYTNYNETMFRGLDYVIAEASKRDIRLQIVLVNNWNAYGGVSWWVAQSPTSSKVGRNENGSDYGTDAFHDQFWNDTGTMQIFQTYINYTLNRNNSITGIQYKNDPAIFAWLLVNEPRCKSCGTDHTRIANWTRNMTAYVKSIDSNHLVGLGMEGFGYVETWGEGTDMIAAHNGTGVDFATFELHPEQWDYFAQRSEGVTNLDWIDGGITDNATLDWWSTGKGYSFNNRYAGSYVPAYTPALTRHGYENWVSQNVNWSTNILGMPVLLQELALPTDVTRLTDSQKARFFNNVIYNFYSRGGDGIMMWNLNHDAYAAKVPSMDDGYSFYYSSNQTLRAKSAGVINAYNFVQTNNTGNTSWVTPLNNYGLTFSYNISVNTATPKNASLWLNITNQTGQSTQYFMDQVNATTVINGTNTFTKQFASTDKSLYWYVTVCDTSDNCNSLDPAYILLADVPVITLVSPADNYVSNLSNFTLNYTVSDGLNVNSCSLWIEGSINKTNSATITSGAMQNFSFIAPLPQTYNWQISCIDIENNTAYSSVSAFTYQPERILTTFVSQTPQDVTATSSMDTPIQIVYNISAPVSSVNISSVNLYWLTNDSLRKTYTWLVNGSVNNSGYTSYGVSFTNVSDLYTFTLGDNIYPASYLFPFGTFSNGVHSYYNMITANSAIKVIALNVSNATHYNTLEYYVRNISASSPSLRIYYCNSSYMTGNVDTSTNCVQFASQLNTHSNVHTHNSSVHYWVPFAINTTTGTLSGVKITPDSWFVFRGRQTNGWEAGYLPSLKVRANGTSTSTNAGTSWSELDGTLDYHIHQLTDDDKLNYYICANSTGGSSNCSTVRIDALNLTAQPPTAPVIISPLNGTYNGTILINYSTALSPNDYAITMYNITLQNSDGTFAQTITANNSLNLTYQFNTSTATDGTYVIYVYAFDSQGAYSFGQSREIIIDNVVDSVASVVVGAGAGEQTTVVFRPLSEQSFFNGSVVNLTSLDTSRFTPISTKMAIFDDFLRDALQKIYDNVVYIAIVIWVTILIGIILTVRRKK